MLPTSIGGDGMRIFETTRRHPGQGGPVAGSVLLERALGGAATLLLAAIGFVLAIGHYDVGAYLWVELGFVIATVVLAVVLFSSGCARRWRGPCPCAKWLRVEKPLRAVYEGIHAYRDASTSARRRLRADCRHPGRARARDLALRRRRSASTSRRASYYVMGPLLFLVMLVPFTINGLAVREAFFVSFLDQARRQRRCGLRDRVPLLRGHDLPLDSGRGDPGVGGSAQADAPGPDHGAGLT